MSERHNPDPAVSRESAAQIASALAAYFDLSESGEFDIARALRAYADQECAARLREVALRLCRNCYLGNVPAAAPIYTDKPQPVRWFHRWKHRPDDSCAAGAVHDALQKLSEGGKPDADR